MRILVACESSGHVRDALLRKGHDAISCDIKPTDNPGPHITGNVLDVLGDNWDMVIGFPPCTYLSNANTPCVVGKCPHPPHDEQWREWRKVETINAALFFHAIREAAPITAVENPRPNPPASALMGKHTCYTEPWWFGHPWLKRTCWWLKGLQPLYPTNPVIPTHRLVDTGRYVAPTGDPTLGGMTPPPRKLVKQLPGMTRNQVERSVTPLGLAEAIADQWTDRQSLF